MPSTRFFVFCLILASALVAADRRGAPPVIVSTPFSSSEQALLGQSHCEDCLFGSSSSVFHVPPEEDLDVVKEVKTTSTKKEAPVNSQSKANKKSSGTMPFGIPKPAFIEKQ